MIRKGRKGGIKGEAGKRSINVVQDVSDRIQTTEKVSEQRMQMTAIVTGMGNQTPRQGELEPGFVQERRPNFPWFRREWEEGEAGLRERECVVDDDKAPSASPKQLHTVLPAVGKNRQQNSNHTTTSQWYQCNLETNYRRRKHKKCSAGLVEFQPESMETIRFT